MSQTEPSLWQKASHADVGKAFDRAIPIAQEWARRLDRTDPFDRTALAGFGVLVNLVYDQLEYVLDRSHQRDPEGLLGAFAEELGGYRQQLKEAAVPVKEAQVEGKLSELGVTPADAPPPATPRAELPSGSFALTMRLRVSGIDARLPQRGKRRRITVPAADEAVALGVMEQWQVEPGDPLADGRTLLRRKALAVPA